MQTRGGHGKTRCVSDGTPEAEPAPKRGGISVVLGLLALNSLLIGLLAWSFTQGPYYNHQQVVWYRYGPLAFLFAGALLPAVALSLGAYRSRRAVGLLVKWMAATLLTCFVYACLSGGGV